MDPWGISTGVAGFLSLAIEITKILRAYISDAKNALEDANKLLMGVISLEQLVKFLREDAKALGNFGKLLFYGS